MLMYCSFRKYLFHNLQRRRVIAFRDVGLREDDDDDVVHEGKEEPLDALEVRDAAQGARRVRHRAREEEIGAGEAIFRDALPVV